MKIKPIALANTFAIMDLVGHTFFHIWIALSPQSYEHLMQLFVAGLSLEVNQTIELSPSNLLLSTALEAGVFWILGFIGANIYNKLAKE